MIAGALTAHGVILLLVLSVIVLVIYTLWWLSNVGIRKAAKWWKANTKNASKLQDFSLKQEVVK